MMYKPERALTPRSVQSFHSLLLPVEMSPTLRARPRQNGYRPVSLERAVKCPHCGHEENVDLEDFMYDESSYEKENGMGPDLVYSFNSEDCYECPECGHTLKIEGWIREYPMGAYDSEDIKVEDCGGDEDDE